MRGEQGGQCGHPRPECGRGHPALERFNDHDSIIIPISAANRSFFSPSAWHF